MEDVYDSGSLPGPNRWLGLWLDMLGAIIVSSTAAFCLTRGDSLSPGLTGLSLSYALSRLRLKKTPMGVGRSGAGVPEIGFGTKPPKMFGKCLRQPYFIYFFYIIYNLYYILHMNICCIIIFFKKNLFILLSLRPPPPGSLPRRAGWVGMNEAWR